MWNYIYYSIYLDQIDISDHNAIEQFVSREVRIWSLSVVDEQRFKCPSVVCTSYQDHMSAVKQHIGTCNCIVSCFVEWT